MSSDLTQDPTYFTKEHEWVTVHGETATIGITKYAAEQLGDVVFIEFPAVGDSFEKGGNFAVVESTKTAADVYAPVSGEVVEVNTALEDNWEVMDSDPEAGGWIAKIRLAKADEAGELMDRAAYDEFLKGL
jgi:glycine cleavage system H protein